MRRAGSRCTRRRPVSQPEFDALVERHLLSTLVRPGELRRVTPGSGGGFSRIPNLQRQTFYVQLGLGDCRVSGTDQNGSVIVLIKADRDTAQIEQRISSIAEFTQLDERPERSLQVASGCIGFAPVCCDQPAVQVGMSRDPTQSVCVADAVHLEQISHRVVPLIRQDAQLAERQQVAGDECRFVESSRSFESGEQSLPRIIQFANLATEHTDRTSRASYHTHIPYGFGMAVGLGCR